MDMAAYLVTAVLVEGRSAREVAAAHGVSKSWVYELLTRYRHGGEAGLAARSRRPKRSRPGSGTASRTTSSGSARSSSRVEGGVSGG